MNIKTINFLLSALFTAFTYSPTVTCFMAVSGEGKVSFEAENLAGVVYNS